MFGSASPRWGSRSSAAAGRYAPNGPGLAPFAMSALVRRAVTPRALTRMAGSHGMGSGTDRGTDRNAARMARSWGYRLAMAVHRSTFTGWASCNAAHALSVRQESARLSHHQSARPGIETIRKRHHGHFGDRGPCRRRVLTLLAYPSEPQPNQVFGPGDAKFPLGAFGRPRPRSAVPGNLCSSSPGRAAEPYGTPVFVGSGFQPRPPWPLVQTRGRTAGVHAAAAVMPFTGGVMPAVGGWGRVLSSSTLNGMFCPR